MLKLYVSKPDALVISKQTSNDQIQQAQNKIPELVKDEVEKQRLLDRNTAMRMRLPFNINSNTNPDRKPLASVPFSYLRRMAITYPIARACINRRIRQITQLDWDITTIDDIEGEKGFEQQITIVKSFFKRPMGHKTRMRELLTIMIDDILTIDATCFEMQKTRGGEFMYLIPVDPTTIALRVTDTGGTPEPPEYAYEQYINGHKIAGFTTDEMVYDFMGNRSYSPYGLAPLESLIFQVEAAILGALYNLSYFKESNVPEGFITLPEEVATNKERVEEWQLWFDAIMSGDPRMQHKLKILPGGAEYTPAKKPEDMAFEKFELWLLQQTCAVFDVPPQDIGITYQVNKATSESQRDLSRERGLIPLGNFVKEFLDELIQEEMGFEFLQFNWRNINPVDRKEEIEIAEKEINLGALGVDEYRIAQGRKPLGIKPFIMTAKGPLPVDDFVSGKFDITAVPDINPTEQNISPDDQQKQKMELIDLKRWRKCIYRDLEQGKKLRTRFPSEYIDQEIHDEIEKSLKVVNNKFQAKMVFDQFIDPELRASMTLLKYAGKLREIEHDFTPIQH